MRGCIEKRHAARALCRGCRTLRPLNRRDAAGNFYPSPTACSALMPRAPSGSNHRRLPARHSAVRLAPSRTDAGDRRQAAPQISADGPSKNIRTASACGWAHRVVVISDDPCRSGGWRGSSATPALPRRAYLDGACPAYGAGARRRPRRRVGRCSPCLTDRKSISAPDEAGNDGAYRAKPSGPSFAHKDSATPPGDSARRTARHNSPDNPDAAPLRDPQDGAAPSTTIRSPYSTARPASSASPTETGLDHDREARTPDPPRLRIAARHARQCRSGWRRERQPLALSDFQSPRRTKTKPRNAARHMIGALIAACGSPSSSSAAPACEPRRSRRDGDGAPGVGRLEAGGLLRLPPAPAPAGR